MGGRKPLSCGEGRPQQPASAWWQAEFCRMTSFNLGLDKTDIYNSAFLARKLSEPADLLVSAAKAAIRAGFTTAARKIPAARRTGEQASRARNAGAGNP